MNIIYIILKKLNLPIKKKFKIVSKFHIHV
jgi:hypothetical protein